jgi:hypothetical protein
MVAIAGLAAAAVGAAFAFAGRDTVLLGSAAVSTSPGEDSEKLEIIERLRRSIRPGMSTVVVQALLGHERVGYERCSLEQGCDDLPQAAENYRIIGLIHRVRWDAIVYEDVMIDIAIRDSHVAGAAFKSFFTGP